MSRKPSYKYVLPDMICKYLKDGVRACYNDDRSPNKCDTCSKNPHRFDNRPVTKGQIIFLTSKGYSEAEISNWDYLRAGEEIRKYK